MHLWEQVWSVFVDTPFSEKCSALYSPPTSTHVLVYLLPPLYGTCLLQEELAQVKKFFSRVIKNIFSIFFNNILCFVLHVLAFSLLECSPVLAAPVLSAKGNAFCLSGEPFIKPIALFTLGDLICLQVRILLLLCDSCLDKSFPRQ